MGCKTVFNASSVRASSSKFQIDNYFVAVGMNGNSLQGCGGVGQVIAEWIMYGCLAKEMLAFDVRRFIDLHNNRRYLKERTREIVGR